MNAQDTRTMILALGGVWLALILIITVCILANQGPCDPADAGRASCQTVSR